MQLNPAEEQTDAAVLRELATKIKDSLWPGESAIKGIFSEIEIPKFHSMRFKVVQGIKLSFLLKFSIHFF